MSQFDNLGQPTGAPNPFSTSPGGFPPPKKSNAWLYILLGVGGTLLLVCCGCGGLFMFGFSQVGKPLMLQLNADPTSQQHLGTVTSAQLDFVASTKATEQAGGGGNIMVFNVKGDKGAGVVRAHQAPGGRLNNATLVLSTGEEIKLGF
jgi:hypothetical protein